MNTRTQVRGLMALSMLAIAIASVPFGTAYAMPKRPGDGGTRCVYYAANGEIQYYLPGDMIAVNNSVGGLELVRCGSDGHWSRA